VDAEQVGRGYRGLASHLAARSRVLPSSRDFHFYNNYPAFKFPVAAAAALAEDSLGILHRRCATPPEELYIYDLMRLRLIKELSGENDNLLEVNPLLTGFFHFPSSITQYYLTALLSSLCL
jgi:hypothetical protein